MVELLRCKHRFHEKCVLQQCKSTGIDFMADLKCPTCHKLRLECNGDERPTGDTDESRQYEYTLLQSKLDAEYSKYRAGFTRITQQQKPEWLVRTEWTMENYKRIKEELESEQRSASAGSAKELFSPVTPTTTATSQRSRSNERPRRTPRQSPFSPITTGPGSPAASLPEEMPPPPEEMPRSSRGEAASLRAEGSSPIPQGCSAASDSTIDRGIDTGWSAAAAASCFFTSSPGDFTTEGQSSQGQHRESPASAGGDIPAWQDSQDSPPTQDPSTPPRRREEVLNTQQSPPQCTQGGHALPTFACSQLGFCFTDTSRAGHGAHALQDQIPIWKAQCDECPDTKTETLLYPLGLFSEFTNNEDTYKTVRRQGTQSATRMRYIARSMYHCVMASKQCY